MEESPILNAHMDDRRRLAERLETDPVFRAKYLEEQAVKAKAAEADALIAMLAENADNVGEFPESEPLPLPTKEVEEVKGKSVEVPTSVDINAAKGDIAALLESMGKVTINITTVNIYINK